MDSATWCRTPAAASAARRLRPEVSKNSSTALSSNEGELARSTTTCAPAMASLSPWPVMVFTPVLGEAATTSWPPWRRMATVFEPIRPVPPMTTIFMVYRDRKSTRLNSSHLGISYAVFCLNNTSAPVSSTLSLHDALPIFGEVDHHLRAGYGLLEPLAGDGVHAGIGRGGDDLVAALAQNGDGL